MESTSYIVLSNRRFSLQICYTSPKATLDKFSENTPLLLWITHSNKNYLFIYLFIAFNFFPLKLKLCLGHIKDPTNSFKIIN